MSPEDFESRFVDICQSHRAQGRALAFGFILHTVEHPYIRDALARDSFWDALDDLSGIALTIFSCDLNVQVSGSGDSGYNPGRVYQMVGIPIAPEVFPRASIERYFSGLNDRELPLVLFFQVDNGEITDSFAVPLQEWERGVEPAFNELRDVIGTAATSLEKVKDEYAADASQMLTLVREAMHGRGVRIGGLRIIRTAARLSGVGSVLKLIASLT